MKPGNLHFFCKVPNPAVRRKMRLEMRLVTHPVTGVRFLANLKHDLNEKEIEK